MLLKWRGRGSQKYPQALSVVFVVLLFYQAISKRDIVSVQNSSSAREQSAAKSESLPARQAALWRALYGHVLNNDPRCSAPELLPIPHKLDNMYNPDHDVPRPDILWLKPQDVDKIKSAHAKFLQDIHDDPLTIPFQPGTQGIAVTASYDLLPVLTISLRMIRRTGCTLPVEVFLGTSTDYDPNVCERIFPTLNAKCIIFQDIVSAAGTGVALTRYQHKIMALLFSSFETVLLLDSDAFPVTNPTYLLTSPPLTTHGLILFPDFWYPTESPYYFSIASISPTPPLNARPATESGELLIHKPSHHATLLLAAYYNYYGPDLYYPLHSQGAPGQGDKETFGWAAAATHSPFYTVHTPVRALGHLDSSGAFVGSAMAQHDPVADYALHRLPSSSSSSSSTNHDPNAKDADNNFPAPQRAEDFPIEHGHSVKQRPQDSVKPLFIHANFPKFDPATLFLSTTQPPGKPGPTFDSNGTKVRPWGNSVLGVAGGGAGSGGKFGADGHDVERAFWREIEYVACEWQEGFGAWEQVRIQGLDVCKVVRNWVGNVFGVEEEASEGRNAVGEDEGRSRGDENAMEH